MENERKKILSMLAEGKISTDEANQLLGALEKSSTTSTGGNVKPKYLRILVEEDHKDRNPTKINVRVPLNLLRAGVKLASLIPQNAKTQVNQALHEKGLDIDLTKLDIEELLQHLNDLTVDVDDHENKVRIFCE